MKIISIDNLEEDFLRFEQRNKQKNLMKNKNKHFIYKGKTYSNFRNIDEDFENAERTKLEAYRNKINFLE